MTVYAAGSIRESVVADEWLEALLGKLSLEQKVRMVSGRTRWLTWPEPSIGLGSMVMSDGPVGVRGTTWDERLSSLLIPSPSALAASWDEDLVTRIGGLLAREAKRKSVDVLLAPTINLHRSPVGGRHFECYSEDPLLTARIGCAYVTGVQSEGVAACAKHYVGNDAESDRFTIDNRIDETTLRELYLAPFEAMVSKAGVWTVMSGYNGVNGATMSENPLQASPLKDEWGFDGVVISDWGAVRSVEASARAALDIAMPGPNTPWAQGLLEAVRAGQVSEAAIDDKVRRLLRLAYRVGKLDKNTGNAEPEEFSLSTEDDLRLLTDAAVAGSVLLRNTGVLPLKPTAIRRVAVVGQAAVSPRAQGGGSAEVFPAHVVTPLEGITEAFGDTAAVVHAVGGYAVQGAVPLTRDDMHLPGSDEPGILVQFLDANGCELATEVRLAGHILWNPDMVPDGTAVIELRTMISIPSAGTWKMGVAGVGDFSLELDGELAFAGRLDSNGIDPSVLAHSPPFTMVERTYEGGHDVAAVLRHTRNGNVQGMVSLSLGWQVPAAPEEEELERAVTLARDADVAIVVVGTTIENEREGEDRKTLALPGNQDRLVSAVAAVNPNTVVIVNTGAPVLMPWRDEVGAILVSWFGGQAMGHAVAEILLGRREPGGRLPTTWPTSDSDSQILDTRGKEGVLRYSEGPIIGHRAWVADQATPAFWFGHGLGYTEWEYLGVDAPDAIDAAAGATIGVRLANRGTRAGCEVIQVYCLRPDAPPGRPRQWLAGFTKVEAEPGTEVRTEVAIAPEQMRRWSSEAGGWIADVGATVIAVGRSAGDVLLTAPTTIR